MTGKLADKTESFVLGVMCCLLVAVVLAGAGLGWIIRLIRG